MTSGPNAVVPTLIAGYLLPAFVMDRSALDPDEVAEIYDELIDTYEAEWERQGHRSLHLEYYDDEHDEPGPAAINTMRVLSEAAGISEGERVLNIGCGVGEDSVWNARAYGATVIGVNISERQLELARENARNHDVSERTEFRYDDFHELATIEADSVDVVWGLEALSHAHDRERVLEQIRRVLVPGGRIVFSDLFVREGADTTPEDGRLQRINDGLGLRLGRLDSFTDSLEAVGFENVTVRDETDPIRPCLDRRHKFARVAHPVGRLLSFTGVFSDTQLAVFKANSLIRACIEANVLGYFVITAELSENREE